MFNLSEPQKAIYYLAVLSENSTTNVAGDVFFDFDVSVDAAREVAAAFLNSCNIMHTRIVLCDGVPMQRIEEKNITAIDIEVKEFDIYSEYEKWALSDAVKPINIYDCLYRLYVIKIDKKVGFYCATHHIINDATSFNIMASFACQYLKEKNTKTIYPYIEYIKNEEAYKQSKRFEKDKAFWINIYNNCEDEFSVETYVRPGKSARKSIIINEILAEKIKKYCIDSENSEYSVFMAIVAIWYHRYLQKDSFFIGSPMLNRSNSKEENTFGLFVNTVPIPFFTCEKNSFSDLCVQTKDCIMSAFRHQKYHYTQLLKDIGNKKRGLDSLFDVIVSFVNAKTSTDAHIGWFCTGSQKESLQIHIEDRENNGVFKMHYDYQIEKFNEQDIEKIHNHLCNLFSDAIENPSKKITELEMLSAEEKQKILYDFNDTTVEYPKDKCVHQLFEEQVEKTPEKTAVVACDKTLTYKELNESANRIAHSLIEKGIGRGDIVAFILPRRSYMISTIIGILKSGAAYMPIDPDYPHERIEYLLKDSGAKYCINEINLAELALSSNVVNPNISIADADIFCALHTSGSTGKPKMSLLKHNSMMNFITANSRFWQDVDTVVSSTIVTFDAFQMDSVLSISQGKKLVLAHEDEIYNQTLFEGLFEYSDKNMFFSTPTKLENYINSSTDKRYLSKIKSFVIGGEVFSDHLFELIKNDSTDSRVYNIYGPTETTICVMVDKLENGKDITIGKPIANTQIYIVDKYMKPVPIGVTGELCIAGDCVGAGYLNRPKLTAERFIDNPFGKGKLYKTGDLAYWRDDGNIVFVGRNDFQVKIRGLRIELGEIESAISNIDGIIMPVVVVRKDNQDRQLICAFYTGEEKSSKYLREELGKSLPKYMMPHIFTRLEEMPLTSSGKINRKALPEIDLESIITEVDYIASYTQKEKALEEAVCDVLYLSTVSMLDNFFDVGGDSIKAIYIVSALEEKGYELHVADIMQKETFADIAKVMKETTDSVVYAQNEVNGLVPFTPIMRAYIKDNGTVSSDFVHTCVFVVDCDENIARKAIDALISHHDILRGTLSEDGIEIHPFDKRIAYSFEAICIADAYEAKEYLKTIRLREDKLINVVFCSTVEGNLISITVHHFLIDLLSWEIVIKDFNTAIKQLKNNEQVSLPAKTAAFKLWSEMLHNYSEKISEESSTYWKNTNEKLKNVKPLHLHQEDVNEAEVYNYTFDKDISDKIINEVKGIYNTRVNEVLLTALGLAACKIAGGSVGIVVESHGRTALDKVLAVERTVGWFTSCYPVVFDDQKDISNALISTKEELRNIAENGSSYFFVSNDLPENTDIIFNFYESSTADKMNVNKLVDFVSGSSAFSDKISVDCIITNGILTVNISVPRSVHIKRICKKLGEEFFSQLMSIVDLCAQSHKVIQTLSDFSDEELTQDELNELKDLFEWTDFDEEQ